MADMFLLLVAPFDFAFMQQALVVGLIAALPLSLLSCFMIVRGKSLIGDALSHAILPGAILSAAANVPTLIGAFASAVSCTLITEFVTSCSKIKHDTALGITFSGLFAAGIVLYLTVPTHTVMEKFLFGHVLGVTWHEVAETSLISIGILICLFLWGRDLVVFIFDSTHARLSGLAAWWLKALYVSLIALSAVSALHTLGMVLSISLFILPGATSYLMANRFRAMLALSCALTIFCIPSGLIASFYLDSSPAATVVLLFSLCFGTACLVNVYRTQRFPLQQREP